MIEKDISLTRTDNTYQLNVEMGGIKVRIQMDIKMARGIKALFNNLVPDDELRQATWMPRIEKEGHITRFFYEDDDK